MKDDKTIKYYNEYAKKFVENTTNVEFRHMQNLFLDKLQKGAYILDFGCGSGRDTKYFLGRGVQIRILTGNYLGITQPSALFLIKKELGDKVELRFYNDKERFFHPKSYIFHYENMSRFFI